MQSAVTSIKKSSKWPEQQKSETLIDKQQQLQVINQNNNQEQWTN